MTNDPALRNDPIDPDSHNDFSTRTFEELVTELERVAMAMDRGEIGIEEAADLYERASALHAAATERLVGVQRRLAELRGTGIGGSSIGGSSIGGSSIGGTNSGGTNVEGA